MSNRWRPGNECYELKTVSATGSVAWRERCIVNLPLVALAGELLRLVACSVHLD